MATTAYDYLHELDLSDVDAEGRRLLGDEVYTKLLQEGQMTVSKLVAHLVERNTTRTTAEPKQHSLFEAAPVDGKTAAAGPDR